MSKKTRIIIYKESVMDAAEKLFESKGYDATSVDEIAFNTGISKATLYAYYRSKEEIWDSLMCRYMGFMLEDARKAAEGEGSFEQRFTNFALTSLPSLKNIRLSIGEHSERSPWIWRMRSIRRSTKSVRRQMKQSLISSEAELRKALSEKISISILRSS